MAERSRLTNVNWKTAALRPLAIWGVAAFGALTIAVLSGYSSSRATVAAGGNEASEPWAAAPLMAQLVARSNEMESETRRLADVLADLTTDRDRLLARIATFERSLEDVTGSTKRTAPATPAPAAPTPAAPPTAAATPPAAATPAAAPAPAAAPVPKVPVAAAAPPLNLLPANLPAASPPAASPPAAPSPAVTASLMAPAPLSSRDHVTPNMEPTPAATDPSATRRGATAPAEAPELGKSELGKSELGKPEIGVDVGGGASFDALRGIWQATKAVEIGMFEGLRPLVMARETKTRGTDLRLIVGPLPNQDAATRLCVALSVERRYCQPTTFEGQELSLNVTEREPERRPTSSSSRRAVPTPPQRSTSRPRS